MGENTLQIERSIESFMLHLESDLLLLIENLRHTFDQKRLKQPLYRHPWEDVLYTK